MKTSTRWRSWRSWDRAISNTKAIISSRPSMAWCCDYYKMPILKTSSTLSWNYWPFIPNSNIPHKKQSVLSSSVSAVSLPISPNSSFACRLSKHLSFALLIIWEPFSTIQLLNRSILPNNKTKFDHKIQLPTPSRPSSLKFAAESAQRYGTSTTRPQVRLSFLMTWSPAI